MKSIRFTFMFMVYVFVMVVYYNQSYNFLIQTTTKNIEHTLVNHSAIRKIINKHYIPEIQRLKEEKLLDKNYINPFFTSGTLLTQTLHEYTKPILLEKGEETTIYKLASLNPLNLKNQANSYEENIFKNLHTSKENKFIEVVEENNGSYLFYSEFFPEIKQRCLKCHDTPENAPINQVKKYGSTHGYGYKVGDPSALITMRAPLDKEILEMQIEFMKTGLIIFFVFVLFYIVAELILFQLNKQKIKISKSKAIHNKLIKESQIDSLTGLLNRRPLEEIFKKERNRARRDNKVVVILLIDIDYFKKYNDRYGHIKGDEALKSVSKALSQCFNRSNEHVFRYGGEEFIVISSEHDLNAHIIRWIDNLKKTLADMNIEHQDSIHKYLTLSIGAYILDPKNSKVKTKELIQKADEALYEAKENGRNQTVIYGEEKE